MPSSFSAKYRLELPAFGEKPNAWGPIVNNNLGVLLEQAIDGFTSVAMPDSNLTLSSVNAGVDQSRSKMLYFSGTLSAAREVILPSTSRALVVWNATNQSLTYKTAAGLGVTIPTGARTWIMCDGVNTVELSSYANIIGGSVQGMSSVSASEILRGTNNLADYAQRVINSSYILTDADRHRSIHRVGAGECYVLLPLNSVTAFPRGTVILVTTGSSASETIVGPLEGVTMRRANTTGSGPVFLPASSAAWLVKVDTDEWFIIAAAGAGALIAANNLSDVTSAPSARTNLGLGTAAIATIGTSGTAVPLLSASNTHTDARGVAAAATSDLQFGFRRLRAASISVGTPVAADSDSCIYAVGNITLPSGVFTRGDRLSIYNDNDAFIEVTQGAGLLLRRDGTLSTGSRNLAGRARAEVLYISASEAVIRGVFV